MITDRPLKYAGLYRRCSDTIFSTRRDHKSKSLKFNIFLADYIRYTRTKTIEALKYSSLKRRCSDPIFSTSRDINRNRINYIFFAGYIRYTSTSTDRPLKYSGLDWRCSYFIFSTRRDHKSKSLQFNISLLVSFVMHVRRRLRIKYSGLEQP